MSSDRMRWSTYGSFVDEEKIMACSDGDFSNSTKAIIAMNAGFQCSYPGCSVLTGLPKEMLKDGYKKLDGFKETLLVGEAAHIVASKKGGPRGGYPSFRRGTKIAGEWDLALREPS